MEQAALGALRPALRTGVEAALEGRRLTGDQALALADARGAEHPALWAAATWRISSGLIVWARASLSMWAKVQ